MMKISTSSVMLYIYIIIQPYLECTMTNTSTCSVIYINYIQGYLERTMTKTSTCSVTNTLMEPTTSTDIKVIAITKQVELKSDTSSLDVI